MEWGKYEIEFGQVLVKQKVVQINGQIFIQIFVFNLTILDIFFKASGLS